MPITVICECGKKIQTKDENAGRHFACTECGRELVVPQAGFEPYDTPPGPLGGFDEPSTSGKAITSLVLGILSFPCVFFAGIPAIIFGAIGLSDIGKSHGRLKGKGMAIAGIVMGGLGSTFMVVAVLIALLLPAVQAAREAARRAQCVNNLKQMGLAFHNFHSAEGHLPPSAIADAEGKPLLSWRVAILPYIEEEALYKQFKLDEPWDSPTNKALIGLMPKVYICPSEPPSPERKTHYQMIVGAGAIAEGTKGLTFDDVKDGISNTFLVVEGKDEIPWTKPDDIDIASVTSALGSKHPGGFNAVFADGSVKFIRSSVPPVIIQALSTRAGGEALSPAAF